MQGNLKFNFKIEFLDEIGLDDRGLTREWFYLVNEELKKSDYLVTNTIIYDVNTEINIDFDYFIDENEAEIVKDIYLRYNLKSAEVFYTFLGIFIAFSIIHGECLSIKLSTGFYANLLNRNFTEEDVYDKELLNNVKKAIENEDSSSNYQNFIKNGDINYRELMPMDIYDFIYVGFVAVLKNRKYLKGDAYAGLIDNFTKDDICLLMNPQKIDRTIIRQTISFEMLNGREIEKRWLMDILEEADEKFLIKFTQFVCGGISMIKTIKIRQFNDTNKLFSASTCVNTLFMSKYSTKEVMLEKLKMSICETEGFHKR